MTTTTVLLTGAGFGALGQIVRAVIGLKKAWDAAPPGTAFNQTFNAHYFLITLTLGVAVGAAAGLLTSYLLTIQGGFFSKEQILLLVASGYAGTDALEGLFSKAVASSS